MVFYTTFYSNLVEFEVLKCIPRTEQPMSFHLLQLGNGLPHKLDGS